MMHWMPCIAASEIAMSRKSRNKGTRIDKKAKGHVRKASAKTDALTEILDK
jgi:hypothetical protein